MHFLTRTLVGVVLSSAMVVPSPARSQSPTSRKDSIFTAEDGLDVVSYTVLDLTRDGRWVASVAASRRDGLGVDYRRDGDPTYVRPGAGRVWVIDTKSGATRALFPEKRIVHVARWSPDDARLAMLVFDSKSAAFQPIIWERESGRLTTIAVPAGTYVAENSELRWTADGKRLVYALHTFAWRKAAQDSFAVMTAGPVFVQSSEDPFLTWDALRRRANLRSVVAYDLATAKTVQLLPETMVASWDVSDDGSTIAYTQDITKKTDYDVIFGTENKLMARGIACQAADDTCSHPRVLLPTLKSTNIVWSEDGAHYAYSKEGRVYVAAIGDTASRQVAGPPADAHRDTPQDTSREARERRDRERFRVVRYSPANDALLVANSQGYWVLELPSANKQLVVESSDSASSTLPRASVAAWSNDGKKIYFTVASRTKWERGVVRFDRSTGNKQTLVSDGRSYSGIRLSKDGRVATLTVAEGNRPPTPFVTDADFSSIRPLVNANPQLSGKRFGPTGLVSYLDADGHPKYAVVYYPVGYERGKAYPTIFIVYEDFFDDTFDPVANVLTTNGYVVVKPSVDFDIGYPGEAWIKGVSAAANKLIDMGVADSARLGVQGTSYGGYATNLLVTQTNRFKAAINISGKVDVISFYTDSPRLGVRNVHAAEKSQDRLGATLWQQPQKYVQQSAIMFADRIQTPLMLITGAQDSNVPADNTREMYYALRRLGKEVVWINYMNGGHGGGNATAEDVLDMQRRMLAWYDAKLKRPPSKVASASP
ncbi:MAG TPA: prolyl oligopeptidase family serine peptidase [Gemmatimonadaceae bacterium]|jgi:dipeptidyl aminopeptidase/acylaminoacyl peptidase